MIIFRNGLIVALLSTLLWIGLLPGLVSAQEPSTGIPEGYMIIEGDIIVPDNFYEEGDTGIQSAFGDTDFWPNGNVPFVFDNNVSQANQAQMLAAMRLWENVANVDFRPRNGERNFVRIQNSTENSSFVGMVGGEQVINIVSWNSQFIMAHELAHCLGFWHEQSRPDRDHYVTINWNNIQQGLENNFRMQDAADVYPKREYGLPDEQTYDFDSVMHYSRCTFSIDCPAGRTCNCTNQTITVPSPNQAWQNLIGQRNHLSQFDQLTMSFVYPENNWYFVDRTDTTSGNGSFLNPYREFTTGVRDAPSWSTLWIQPGYYSAVGVYDRPMTLEAPLGNVVLGR
jgi:hypothetical protein